MRRRPYPTDLTDAEWRHLAPHLPEARGNRLTLRRTMERAGFVNYGHEWWHYSYGDRY